MEQITAALLLAAINTKLVDWFKAPIMQRWPDANLWWMTYVAGATGVALTMAAGVNLFGSLIANEILAVVVSGLFVGAGAGLIYDWYDAIGNRPASVTVRAEQGGTVSADVVTEPTDAGAQK